MNEVAEVSARLAEATSSRSLAAMDALLHPAATIWHNSDGVRQDRAQALAAIGAFYAAASESRYAGIRLHAIAGGFVQQHILEVRFGDAGPLLEVPCCLVVEIADGLICRIDEYLDTSPFQPPAS